ncbi:MAG: DUF5677 domain-containing protein [Lachnospiraceae bacterium]|nr:DUF5677 domain-containing protein [Lachnospiraceae bacterium]
MEGTIRQKIRDYIKKYDELKSNIADEDGTIKKEYQSTALDEYKKMHAILLDSFTYDIFGIRENEHAEKLKKLYIYYYLSDEKIYSKVSGMISESPSMKLEAQIRLYMMYLKTLREILYLLSGGYSDCALSRVRRLYEMGVYIEIISKNDENLATRFCKHCNTQSYILAKKLNNNEKTKEISKTVKSFNYEKEFIYDNGWANILFKNKTKINFADLLKLTEYKSQEATYKLTCNFVHPSLLSSLQSLDIRKDDNGKSIWNTSPSDEGIDTVIKFVLSYLGFFISNYKNSFSEDVTMEYLIICSIDNNIWDELLPKENDNKQE